MAETTKVNKTQPQVSPEQFQALQQQNQVLSTRLQQMQQMLEQNMQTQPETKPEPKRELPNFEDMTNEQIVNWMVGEVNKQVDSEVGKVRQEVSDFRKESEEDRIKRELDTLVKEYPDFVQYSSQAARIAERVGGNISAKEAYLLAKQEAGGGTSQPTAEPEEPATQEPEEPTTQEPAATPAEDVDKIRQRTDTGEKPTQSTSGQKQQRFGNRRDAIMEAMTRLGIDK